MGAKHAKHDLAATRTQLSSDATADLKTGCYVNSKQLMIVFRHKDRIHRITYKLLSRGSVDIREMRYGLRLVDATQTVIYADGKFPLSFIHGRYLFVTDPPSSWIEHSGLTQAEISRTLFTIFTTTEPQMPPVC